MFDTVDWSHANGDEIDRGFDQFGGLQAAAAAEICRLIRAAEVAQVWVADGARSLLDWVSARLRIRHATACQLVSVARRLSDLPVLSARFACGDLSLDQTDAISKMATADTEEGLIEEALGLSNLALDGMARRSAGRSTEDERTVWERRRLVRQWNLDESELRFHGNLSAAEGKMFDQAIDDRVNVMGPNPETGMFDLFETRSADALVELAVTTGDQTVSLPQMTVFADLEALTSKADGVAELSNTALIPNETARRLSCDCVLEIVITDGSAVVGVGRNSRTIPVENDEGDEKIHPHPGENDHALLPELLLPVGAPYITWSHLLQWVHPDNPHVATKRNPLEAVLGLASLHRPDLWSEAKEELGRLHPHRLGGQEVTRLMGGDKENDGYHRSYAPKHLDHHPQTTGQTFLGSDKENHGYHHSYAPKHLDHHPQTMGQTFSTLQ